MMGAGEEGRECGGQWGETGWAAGVTGRVLRPE